MNEITERTRKLRKNLTPAEKLIWQKLRYNKFKVKFRRQYPIIFNYGSMKRYFIADFICIDKKLVIEIDGKVHEDQKDYDDARTYIINELGYRVIRFKNEEIFNNLEIILEKILNILN